MKISRNMLYMWLLCRMNPWKKTHLLYIAWIDSWLTQNLLILTQCIFKEVKILLNDCTSRSYVWDACQSSQELAHWLCFICRQSCQKTSHWWQLLNALKVLFRSTCVISHCHCDCSPFICCVMARAMEMISLIHNL